MAEITASQIAEQIRTMLNDDWEIHVDERISFQIPRKPSVRRGKNVRSFSVYVSLYKPIYLYVSLYADSLSALKKRIDKGDLWSEIKKEFEKKAVTLTPEQWESLGVHQQALPLRQLALTHK